MFKSAAKARASLLPGTLYAVAGGDSYIYYGQVDVEKSLGFFRFRTKKLAAAGQVLAKPLMSRFGITYPLIGRALRAGQWFVMGKHELREELRITPKTIQWSVGTLRVSIWKDGKVLKDTWVHDPAIQYLEIIAAYDAEDHVPKRLQLDYKGGLKSWPAGGPIWRDESNARNARRNFRINLGINCCRNGFLWIARH